MSDPFVLTISLLSLFISGTTAWLTLFRKGTVRMTQPTVIFFGPDGRRSSSSDPSAKVFLRTLVYSTSKRGRVIQSMHVSLSRNEGRQNFNVWVYGDDKLVRGSGLFVGETGLAVNHHFLTPRDNHGFQFTAGTYHLDVYVHLVGDKKKKLLFSQTLIVSPEIGLQMENPGTGVYFDWGPDSETYLPSLDRRPQVPISEEFLRSS